jgi:hypothetical protein
VFGSPGLITFRNLSFTMSNNAISAIDIGPQGGPFVPWKDIVVENSVFNMQPNVGRAVRVFGSTLANPKITIQGNQMSGGTFPIVTLTGSPTSTIEVLSNSFTGVVSLAGAQIQSEANVRVEGNTFSSGGCGGHGCIFLLGVSNGLVRNNTMTVSNTNPNISGIKFTTSNGTITQNLIVGVSAGGAPSAEGSYALPVGAIVIQPNSVGLADPDGVSASTVTVNQNTVTNAVAGVRVVGGGSTVTGSNNVFTNVHSALRLDNTNATPSSLTVTSSDFTTYFRPISFMGATPAPSTITATCNWWGNVLGPQNLLAGTPVGSYSPWATGPIANGGGGQCNGNTFAGTLAQTGSVSYSWVVTPQCTWTTFLSGVTFTLKTGGGVPGVTPAFNVLEATSSATNNESVNLVGCSPPFVGTPQNHSLSGPLAITGSAIPLNLTGLPGNLPGTTLEFSGTANATGTQITGTLTWRRVDQAPSSGLAWTISAPITLTRQ